VASTNLFVDEINIGSRSTVESGA